MSLINDDYDEMSRGLLLQFMETVKAEHLSRFVQTDRQKRIYAIARRLCEEGGFDPDRVSMGNERCPAMIDAKGCIALYYPIRPNWVLYISDAIKAIDIVEANPPPE